MATTLDSPIVGRLVQRLPDGSPRPSRCLRPGPRPCTASRSRYLPGQSDPDPARAGPGRANRWRHRPTAAPARGDLSRRLPNFRYVVISSSSDTTPSRLVDRVQQRTGVAPGEDEVVVDIRRPGCPSRSGSGGRSAPPECRRPTYSTSGGPDPALVLDRIESTRNLGGEFSGG